MLAGVGGWSLALAIIGLSIINEGLSNAAVE
jgi:hypothetical protein